MMSEYVDIIKETNDMEKWFTERTKKHIDLVQKYAKKIEEKDERFKGLTVQTSKHDESKLKNPERDPYVHITWYYKCKGEGKNYDPPANIKEMMSKATYHHITKNSHHPEYHTDSIGSWSVESRDNPEGKQCDATKMPDMDIAEMVADWSAVSEEKGTNSPKEWADQNINKRWLFTEKQIDLIYELISKIWD
jgi:hypothetical protein